MAGKWRIRGYDTFEGAYYDLDGEWDTEAEAREAGQKALEHVETIQPGVIAGDIQDRVYLIHPDGGLPERLHQRLTRRVEADTVAKCSPTSSSTSTTSSSTSLIAGGPKTEYVLGFMFDEERQKVLLVEKSAPRWQAGKYNGVGGKIESGESPPEAMAREFLEETGIATEPEDWKNRLSMFGRDWVVAIFETTGNVQLAKQTTPKDTPLIARVGRIAQMNVIPNLRWIIPFLLDKEKIEAVVAYPSLIHNVPSTTTER